MVTKRHGMNHMSGDWREATFGAAANQAHKETAKFIRTFKRHITAKEKAAPPEPAPRIAIRPMSIDDASFVIDSWAGSFRRSMTVGPVPEDVFKIEQRARIDRLICRSKVFIACDAEEKKTIRAWICFEPPRNANAIPIIHYILVHPKFQMKGVGSALVDMARQTHSDKETFMWSTHDTQPMKHIRPKWNLMYNPYLLEVDDRVAAKRATGIAQGTFYGI